MKISLSAAPCREAHLFYALTALVFVAFSPLAWTASPQPLTEDGARAWNVISGPSLSPDGTWLAYTLIRRADTESQVIFKSTTSDLERRYNIGLRSRGAGRLQLSGSGRWAAFLVESGKGSPALNGETKTTALTIVNLSTGQTKEFPGVKSFAFNQKPGESNLGSTPEWIAFLRSSVAKSDQGSEFELLDLHSGQLERQKGVTEFAFNAPGTLLAWAGPSGLFSRDLFADETTALETSPGRSYQGLTWSEKGNAIAVFRDEKSSENQRGEAGILACTELKSGKPRRTLLTSTTLEQFPQDMVIVSPTPSAGYRPGVLTWREDETGLFFNVHPRTTSPESRSPGTEPVVVWHWQADLLPKTATGRLALPSDLEEVEEYYRVVNAAPAFLSYAALDSRKYVQLADSDVQNVQPHPRGRYALGYDARAYEREFNASGKSARDYFLVNIETGERKQIARHLRMPSHDRIAPPPLLSPDGGTLLFVEGDDYIAYEVKSGTRRNLTKDLGTALQKNWPYFRRDRDYYPAIQGWTRDGNHVLVWDRYDIWALSLKGGESSNLTRNGRTGQRRYIRTDLNDSSIGSRAASIVSLSEPLYFRVIDLQTRRTGIACRRPEESQPEILWMEDANVSWMKAAHADTIVCARETAVQAPDWFLFNAKWEPIKKLTDANPQQRDYQWSPGARLLDYAGSSGERLKGVLHLPAGYVEGRSYPTIIALYEHMSQTLHNYRWPVTGGTVSASQDIPGWTGRGYAVLEPDIQPVTDHPGQAALDAVLAGCSAAVASGIVDPQRIALEGHSYGSYEAVFIATQTDRFAAVVAKAGNTNWISHYGTARADRRPTSHVVETYQPYMSAPWWEKPATYLDNSPISHARTLNTPLLLIHGDADASVHFAQAVEMFNALRRVGGKPVVLLQYRNENHRFESASARKDLTARQIEFLDHFLKGAPAPAWWESAIPSRSPANAPPP